MKVLLKQATIICSSSPFHGQVKDILIVDGKIKSIDADLGDKADEIIRLKNLHVSIGWIDIFAHFADPGFEHKETLQSGAAAAAAGGFTDVMIMPNSNPAVSSKSQVEYILQRSSALPVNIYPIASVTKNAEGKELSEMYDMHSSGAVAFSDGKNSIQNAGILTKALQYLTAINRTVIQIPGDRALAVNGLMHEGITSTRLGLPGIPAMAEELMVARDIELLKYTGSRLHLTGISTSRSLELVKEAKKAGLNITCSVTPYHCYFTDEDMVTYDTNLKVDPPLRTQKDRKAIRKGVMDGTVDCIASHHIPEHWDDKTCEFEYAKKGMTGLESLFGVMTTVMNDTGKLVEILTVNNRRIFNIPVPELKEGSAVCLTLFNPDETYIFDESMIKSKSRNCGFTGKELTGKVYGIITHKGIALNQ